MFNRRVFMWQTCIGGVAMIAGQAVAKAVMLDESDPQALALGYHADGTKTDRVRFPNYARGDQCSGCTQFQTLVGESVGACKLFPDKRVAATGWCSAYEVAI